MRDLISRETAKLTLKNYGLNRYMLERMERWIDAQPTIDAVSVVHGEWIRDRYWSRGTGMGEEYGFFYKCSLCEYEVENGYTRCGFNFCPYCGAKMDGERKESE